MSDARFFTLLARRELSPRGVAAELRQAIRARLSRDARLEQDRAGAASAGRRHRAHRAEVSRGARAPHGLAADADGDPASPPRQLLVAPGGTRHRDTGPPAFA